MLKIFMLLLNVIAVVCNAANGFKIESVEDAYKALLAKSAQTRCSGAIMKASEKAANALAENAAHQEDGSGPSANAQAVIDKRCRVQIVNAESSCSLALKELGLEGAGTHLYADKSILDLFAAKAQVGLDELLLKAYKLHNADCVTEEEATELIDNVSAALLKFEKQVSETVFDDLFSPLFRKMAGFGSLKESLVDLCLAPNIRKGFDVLQAAFGLGSFVLNAKDLDTSSFLGSEDYQEISAQLLQDMKANREQYNPLMIMRKSVNHYANQARSKQKLVDLAAELLHDRSRDLLGLQGDFQSQLNYVQKGCIQEKAIPCMEQIMELTHEMTPMSLDEVPGKLDTLKQQCQSLKAIHKKLNQCVVWHQVRV